VKKVALVGRPNVGKSALFNRLARKRLAIVDQEEGVTRDRLYATIDIFGTPIEIIDTGGIDTREKGDFLKEIREQTEIAIKEADHLILIVDAQVGATLADKEVAKMLLKTGKPVTLAVNKIDHPEQEKALHDFHSLGIKTSIAISAHHGSNIAELLESIPLGGASSDPTTPTFSISIVGRPNVGKSTLLNALLGDGRSLVSEIAGTTRDSIDADVKKEGVIYRFIDTAGIRRKHKEKNVIEKFAAIRTERAIKRSDVCLLMIDAQEGLTTQEKKILRTIETLGKAVCILVNKWDTVDGFEMAKIEEAIRKETPFLAGCPILFISAKTGRNLDKIFPLIQKLYRGFTKKISTSELNRIVEGAMMRVNPPMINGKRLRVYYLTQTGDRPPRFILFINHKKLITEHYIRYLLQNIKKTLELEGCPIKIELKAKPPKKK